MPASNPPPAAALPPSAAAEAARYALLRRLTPSMRHHLVVNLQPIGMIYEVMERRLRTPDPDLANVHDSAAKINGFARAALNSSLDVVGWLAPDETLGIAVHEGVRECAALLATSLSFRGFALRNEVGADAGTVRRAALRTMVTGMLVHATDEARPAAELVLSASVGPESISVVVTVRQTQGEKGFASEPAYRPLTWPDLQALAAAEGVQLQRQDQRFEVRLPRHPG